MIGIASIVWYVAASLYSENFLFDSLSALSLLIAFYYALTGIACAIYWRRRLTHSVKSFLFIGLGPVVGAVILLYLLVQSVIQLANPEDSYTGTSILGIGVPLAIALFFIILGVVLDDHLALRAWQGLLHPEGWRARLRRGRALGPRSHRPRTRLPKGLLSDHQHVSDRVPQRRRRQVGRRRLGRDLRHRRSEYRGGLRDRARFGRRGCRPGLRGGRRRRSRVGATPRRRNVSGRCSRSPTRWSIAAEEFVRVESRDTGKPLALTTSDELPPAIDQIRFFAGAARVLEGKSGGEYLADHTSFVRREPIGVVAQVTPWNYPLMMMVWKIAPALAAGNTIVLKPSDTTPASSTLLAELARSSCRRAC